LELTTFELEASELAAGVLLTTSKRPPLGVADDTALLLSAAELEGT
jgi:hypothetical protein